jgi:uncharacterized protein YprB with RNaseH-like and TPR domain
MTASRTIDPVDRIALAARIQEILKNRQTPPQGAAGAAAGAPAGSASLRQTTRVVESDEEAAFAARCAAAEASAGVLDVLGATVLDGAHGPCVVVDRHYPATGKHGRHLLERYVSAAFASLGALPWFLDRQGMATDRPGVVASPRLVCFDLETTGLSGGAGTYAFLVGFGYFDDEGFRTRQFFLRGFGEERALLHAVESEIASDESLGRTVLVTYNGRAFDVPLIDTRYQMHRLGSPFGKLPHVDMLFPARRLWKRRVPADGRRPTADGRDTRGTAFSPQPSAVGLEESAPGSCALTAIERDILGLHRQDDVPGWEIPARYFGYTRTGDARGLAAVLEHNRLDLVSLGAVAAVILEMVEAGVDAVRERHDHLAVGRLYDSLGRLEEAERCFSAAALADGTVEREPDRMARADALHWLALHRRRTRRFEDAAAAWEELARISGLDAERRREALEALAVHHEHRVKNLRQAREFALSALELADDARRVDEVRHRLGRLSRKLGEGPGH